MHASSECLDSSFWQKPGQFCVPTVLFERCSKVLLMLLKMWKNTDKSIALERKKNHSVMGKKKNSEDIVLILF